MLTVEQIEAGIAWSDTCVDFWGHPVPVPLPEEIRVRAVRFRQTYSDLLEADSESWQYLLLPGSSRDKIGIMEELIRDLERKEAECRKLANGCASDREAYRLFGKADGIRITIDDLKALLKRQSEPSDLSELQGEIRLLPMC